MTGMTAARVRAIRTSLACLLALLALGASGCKQAQPQRNPNVSTQQLEAKLAAKDAEAVDLARQLGAAADAALQPYLAAADAEVRELALDCTDAAGGAQRDKRLLTALTDADINVRSLALRHLRRQVDPASLPALLEQLRANEDAYVRGELALIIGMLGAKSASDSVARQATREPDAAARANQVLACARLGDPKARDQIRAELGDADPQLRFAAVKKYEYIADAAILADLSGLLSDQAEVINVVPAHLGRLYMRVCDVVVQVVTIVAKPKLSFDGLERRQFTPAEIQEIAAFLQRRG